VLQQALLAGVIGFVVGLGLYLLSVPMLHSLVPALEPAMRLSAVALTFVVALGVGALGSWAALRKLRDIYPEDVFRACRGASDAIMIEAHDLTRIYDTLSSHALTAVDHVELKVDAGELALVVGPSGRGKTTLLSLLCGMLAPTSGDVVVAGEAVHTLTTAGRSAFRLRQVGFVFQRFRLLDALTVRENVEIVMHLAGRDDGSARKRADLLLRRMQLTHRAGHYPPMLSGGEQQRVALARALANDPPVLLADEPTGNLDTAAGDSVIALLAEAAAEQKAVLIASHDPRIRRRVHRIFHLVDGRLSEA
jgi:putative ABC transport system ATP-binding protein